MWAPVSRPTLTGRNPGRLGVVSVLDAGDQLAAVLQRVPAHEGRLASAALRSVKTAAGEAELRQSAAPPQSRCGPPGAVCAHQPGLWGPGTRPPPPGRGPGRCSLVIPGFQLNPTRQVHVPHPRHPGGARPGPTWRRTAGCCWRRCWTPRRSGAAAWLSSRGRRPAPAHSSRPQSHW